MRYWKSYQPDSSSLVSDRRVSGYLPRQGAEVGCGWSISPICKKLKIGSKPPLIRIQDGISNKFVIAGAHLPIVKKHFILVFGLEMGTL